MRNFDVRPGRMGDSEWRKALRLEDEIKQHVLSIENEGTLRAVSSDEWEENPENQWDREQEER